MPSAQKFDLVTVHCVGEAVLGAPDIFVLLTNVNKKISKVVTQ